MFVYAFYLIGMLEKPFRKGHDTLDDVSLFLLREFDEKNAAAGADASTESFVEAARIAAAPQRRR